MMHGATLKCLIVFFAPSWELVARGVGTFTSNVLNDLFQTGSIQWNNMGSHMGDAMLDVLISSAYLDIMNNIQKKLYKLR